MKYKNRKKLVMTTEEKPYINMLKEMIFKKKGKNPKIVENQKLKLENLEVNSFILLGHSTILLNIDGKVVLTDPVLHRRAVGPLNLLGPRPFKFRNNYRENNLPERIDIILISHNHYDHLDISTLKRLDKKTEKFLVPKGIKELLWKKGIDRKKIEEFQWENSYEISGLKFTYLESQHFSGRGLFDRNQTPWGSWLMESRDRKVFFSGDTGYHKLFKEYGERFEWIDLSLLECGSYSKYWANVHMRPEETVKAGIELKGRLTVPIHNRKYDLALHHWLEPIERFKKKGDEEKLNYLIPELGEVVKF